MSIIPDPEYPETVAIDEGGDLMWGVLVAPAGADPKDPDAWEHVGWSKGLDIRKNPAQSTPESD